MGIQRITMSVYEYDSQGHIYGYAITPVRLVEHALSLLARRRFQHELAEALLASEVSL
jgi:hypothetical protein